MPLIPFPNCSSPSLVGRHNSGAQQVRVDAPPLVERSGIKPAIALEVLGLPPDFHCDSPDRVRVATVRVHSAVQVTRDERILRSGFVRVLAPV